ncbi:hypothetical protein TraAM80_01823 [Trypanosoma rangeli]|uniref:Uncharacterized protein n=1 Tax=Trypanosoma rangeli TaxID=5698 RepID=A0A3R7KUI1_TRYRA|nr:uncharacterized protein TraAM80_01823 [Trypanosoma rangeli]RNF09984.1 hypothetical protein TraAM80_01823 [Trypanosoma rangeli]|eukprot:RNF09984.1 hypothetical protein TraAM80_01823 [Trypanosoma rangeli]
MPPKRKKGGARGKKGKQKPFVDPDEGYRCALDERYYIPKHTRANINQSYLRKILLAIRSFTLAQPPLELETLALREEAVEGEIAVCVPLHVLPHIVRALGFNPSEEQMRQLAWIVLYHGKQPQLHVPESDAGTVVSSQEAGPQDAEAGTETHVKVKLEDMLGNPLDETLAWATRQGKQLMVDRGKLEAVLLDIMHTGLLVFDPARCMQGEAVGPAHERVVSVVDRVNPEVVDDVFDAFWTSSLRHKCKDGVRYIYVNDLERLMTTANVAAEHSELPLTPEELRTFLFFVNETGSDIIREDAFALMAL